LGSLLAERLWRLSVEGVALVANLVGQHRIACDLKPGGVTAATTPADLKLMEQQQQLMRGFGYARTELLDAAAIRDIVASPKYCGGLLDSGTLHLDPLQFARGLARAAIDEGATIHENSAVVRIEPGERPRAITAQGIAEARHIVLAANA